MSTKLLRNSWKSLNIAEGSMLWRSYSSRKLLVRIADLPPLKPCLPTLVSGFINVRAAARYYAPTTAIAVFSAPSAR